MANGKPLSAQSVGRRFVTEYYKVLLNCPEFLRDLYLGSIDNDHPAMMLNDLTMNALNQNIESLEIKSITAEESDNGVIILPVTGFQIAKDHVKRNFAHSFFLAKSRANEKYMILDDIFLPLDDVASDNNSQGIIELSSASTSSQQDLHLSVSGQLPRVKPRRSGPTETCRAADKQKVSDYLCQLPFDILFQIAGHLNSLPELISFHTFTSDFPLLLYPCDTGEFLYDVVREHLHTVPLPWTPSSRFTLSSSNSVFITSTIDQKGKSSEIVLSDIAADNEVLLPDNPYDFLCIYLSEHPDSGKSTVFLLPCEDDIPCQHISLGSDQWSVASFSSQFNWPTIADMIFFRGEWLALMAGNTLQVQKVGGGMVGELEGINKLWLGDIDDRLLSVGMFEVGPSQYFFVCLFVELR